MRGTGIIVGLALLSAADAFGQSLNADQKIAPRYGVSAAVDFYPQGTAKEALASASKALTNKRYEYLVAHLMDPEFIDGKVAEAAALLEPIIEKEFDARRADQKKNPEKYRNEEPLPLDPPQFAERVKAEAVVRGFKKVAATVGETLNEAPENVKLLAKFAKDGQLTEAGAAATVVLTGETKKVYLKQVDVLVYREIKDLSNRVVQLEQKLQRWTIEDRQKDEK